VTDEAWRNVNRTNWDERVAIHLGAASYDLAPLRARSGRLNAIEEAELGRVEGLRILHLQCHFGRDSLVLAQRGARVVGLDFSPAAVAVARALADELGLADRARFVESDLYDAPAALAEPHGFDLVFATWGTITWLPDIRRWGGIVAHFLKPGGALYLAEAHPAALVFDDDVPGRPDGMPGFFAPYLARDPIVTDDPRDYADPAARRRNARQYNWLHPLSAVVGSLLSAGLRLDFLHEHDAVPWRMFKILVESPPGHYRWPAKPWLPLAFSLKVQCPVAGR
jgi:SAM-dependent methyltransferase